MCFWTKTTWRHGPLSPCSRRGKTLTSKDSERSPKGWSQPLGRSAKSDNVTLMKVDAELVAIAELVEEERLERKGRKGRFDARSQLATWQWRLKQLKMMKESGADWLIFEAGWLQHPRCTLKRELAVCRRLKCAIRGLVWWGVRAWARS